jgi:hypothetical protein
MADDMGDLKLIALDSEDLAVLSTHMQDAVLRVGDMAFLKGEQRFAAIANRFDWDEVCQAKGKDCAMQRRRTGLRFERVTAAQLQGIDRADANRVLSLLAIAFEPTDEPRGFITLHFSGGAAVRLDVECIEGELKDLGAAWATRAMPIHGPNGGKTS